MATASEWLAGSRPRTLPAAIAPVLVGTGAAAQVDGADAGLAVLAAAVGLALQVGVNFSNDYSDGIRGTDVDRVGPMRLTASGAAPPHQVRNAAVLAFAVASAFGLWIIVLTQTWWLVGVGVLCIVGAWTYTGGRRPYGYRGLGEVGVFVFFGLVAVLGTTYTQVGHLTWPSVAGAVAIGLLACALLMVNNLRDVQTDALVGKRTLAVRIGDRRARRLYAVMVLLPVLLGAACAPAAPWSLLVLLLAAPAALLAVAVLAGARGIALAPVLGRTGLLELAFGVLLGLGLAA